MRLSGGEIADPTMTAELTDNARALGFELICRDHGTSIDAEGAVTRMQGALLYGNEVHFGGSARECAAFLVGWGALRGRILGGLLAVDTRGLPETHDRTPHQMPRWDTGPRGEVPPSSREPGEALAGAREVSRGAAAVRSGERDDPGKPAVERKAVIERAPPRDQRQGMIAAWAEAAFGHEEATGLPHRGLRLLEEAIEAFQACGGNEEIAHELVTFMFKRAPGMIGQELGGVAVAVLALASAAGLSADAEECREVHRVLSKPVDEFTRRNAARNAAGFKISTAEGSRPRNACCGNSGTHGEGNREYCSTCGADLGGRMFP